MRRISYLFDSLGKEGFACRGTFSVKKMGSKNAESVGKNRIRDGEIVGLFFGHIIAGTGFTEAFRLVAQRASKLMFKSMT